MRCANKATRGRAMVGGPPPRPLGAGGLKSRRQRFVSCPCSLKGDRRASPGRHLPGRGLRALPPEDAGRFSCNLFWLPLQDGGGERPSGRGLACKGGVRAEKFVTHTHTHTHICMLSHMLMHTLSHSHPHTRSGSHSHAVTPPHSLRLGWRKGPHTSTGCALPGAPRTQNR